MKNALRLFSATALLLIVSQSAWAFSVDTALPLSAEISNPFTTTVGGIYGSGTVAGNADLYLRGGFNDYGMDYGMAYADGIYTVTVDLLAGDWDFRISSADLVTVDLGAGSSGNALVELDSERAIGDAQFGALQLLVSQAGTYTFTINTSTGGMATPMLLVSSVSAVSIPEPGILILIGMPLLLIGVLRRFDIR